MEKRRLLISPDFLASKFCYEKEMKRALQRHEAGEAVVIPIIIRPSSWKNSPFSKLQVLPKDAQPVSVWSNQDEAWTNILEGICKVVEKFKNKDTQ